ncbi:MAG: hypothetical protein U9R15_02850, partial [Chloroflexota bacterium]|nr:hypothetical protein [Chloroflexota bacterium]
VEVEVEVKVEVERSFQISIPQISKSPISKSLIPPIPRQNENVTLLEYPCNPQPAILCYTNAVQDEAT